MPQRKQPERLSDVVKSGMRRIIENQIDDWFKLLAFAENYGSKSLLNFLMSIIDEVDTLRKDIYNMEPSVSAQILPDAIKYFNEQVTTYKLRDTRCPIMLVRFEHSLDNFFLFATEALLAPSLQEYNIKSITSGFAQCLSIQSLGALVNVTTLILPGKSTEFEAEDIENNIQYITMLQKFEYMYNCTTQVVKMLAQHCPHLREINCRYSRRISNTCVESLLKLKMLHFIDLQFTCINNRSYKKLLSGLKLSNISWHHAIDSILSGVPQENTQQIHFAACKLITPNILIEKCQNITELTLHAMNTSIFDVTKLPSLEIFNLQSCSYNRVKADNFFRIKGQHLVVLRFYNVKNIRMSQIMEHCSVLVKLEIHCSTFTNEGKCKIDKNYGLFPHFNSLEQLILTDSEDLKFYIDKLAFYRNLKLFHARKIPDLTDSVLVNALSAGHLTNLVEVILEDCSVHKILVPIHLISKCANITKFGNLKKIQSFSEDVVAGFKRHVKTNNYDLTFVSQTKYYVRSNMVHYVPRPPKVRAVSPNI